MWGAGRMIEMTLLSDVSSSVASNFPKGQRARRRTRRANIGPNKLPKQAFGRVAWSLGSNAFIWRWNGKTEWWQDSRFARDSQQNLYNIPASFLNFDLFGGADAEVTVSEKAAWNSE